MESQGKVLSRGVIQSDLNFQKSTWAAAKRMNDWGGGGQWKLRGRLRQLFRQRD